MKQRPTNTTAPSRVERTVNTQTDDATHPPLPTSETNNESRLRSDRFYWAVIEPPPLPTTTESLRYAFEPYIPVPIDEIECRFVRPSNNERRGAAPPPIIACGVDRRVLDDCSTTESSGIGPASLPGFIACSIEPTRHDEVLGCLRFSAGSTSRPKPLRHLSRSKALVLCVVLAEGLLSLGMLRRAAALDRAATRSYTTIAALADDTLGPARGAEVSLPPLVRLQAETRRLARTRESGGDVAMPRDVTGDLIALLDSWPDAFPTRVEQVDLRSGTLTIRGSVRDAADFERLKLALSQRMTGFEPPTGSTSRAREGFRFDLALRADETLSPTPIADRQPGKERTP